MRVRALPSGGVVTSPDTSRTAMMPLGGVFHEIVGVIDIDTGAEFDGTNDWLSRVALVGATQTKFLLASMYIKRSTAATERIYLSITDADSKSSIGIIWRDDGSIQLGISQPGSLSIAFTYRSAAGVLPSDGLQHHVLISRNASTGAFHCYIDDDVESTAPTTDLDFNIPYDTDTVEVGKARGTGEAYTGCLGEFYLTNEYLDLSVTANRRLFLTSAGQRPSLGTDGSTPTGTAPLVYLSGGGVGLHANFGTGGKFIQTGIFTDCALTTVLSLLVPSYTAAGKRTHISVLNNRDHATAAISRAAAVASSGRTH